MLPQSLFSAGSNAKGQLATGDCEDAHTWTPSVFDGHYPGALPSHQHRITNIACGANHTLALLDSGGGGLELWGAGDGSKGQLGPSYMADARDGDSTAIFRQLDLRQDEHGLQGYTPRLSAAGWETSYIVLSSPGRSDAFISMGANDHGNLGVGDIKGKGVARPYYVVDLYGGLPPVITQQTISESLHISALHTGPQHVVVAVDILLHGGGSRSFILGWGAARHGQLGDHSGSGRPPLFYSTPRIVITKSMSELSPTSSIALGNQHTVILRQDGRICGVGSDRKNQLTSLETLEGVSSIGCTWNGTYVVKGEDTDGSFQLLGAGSNNKGQLGRPTPAAKSTLGPVQFPFSGRCRPVKLACGSEHVLCLVDFPDGRASEVWGWGWNEHGNLAVGSTEDLSTPRRLWPPDPVDVCASRAVDIWAGCGTSWIVVEQDAT
ncbi:hypothetical protein CERSUDRAFT_161588 [Gelatoporia subvermispora B]|uniref:RCC1/BLIP-II protein n=1 Tax=Ceriporiopsis subvermispora (strain B) TaxID=914234 RepID=M2R2Z6_CERS8|nr:hypothetical protein CERSUDRAFT_161588 [Gelatoporia subvermispora B]